MPPAGDDNAELIDKLNTAELIDEFHTAERMDEFHTAEEPGLHDEEQAILSDTAAQASTTVASQVWTRFRCK